MEDTINVKVILMSIIKKLPIIILAAIIGGLGSYFYTKYKITPQYSSSAKLYVENKVTTMNGYANADLNSGATLAQVCASIFKTEKVLKPISEQLREEYGYVCSASQLKGMLSVTAAENSSILSIGVTCDDPLQAQQICKLVLDVAPEAYKTVVNTGYMSPLDEPKVNYNPISPDNKKNTMNGALLAAVIVVAIVVLVEIINTKVKPTDDLYSVYGIPVFAEILDFNLKSNTKYRYNSYYEAAEEVKK